MKRGTTVALKFQFDLDLECVNEVIFSFCKEMKETDNPTLVKYYPQDGVLKDGILYLYLTQEETLLFEGRIYIECQLNLVNGSVLKTDITSKVVRSTLFTTLVDGNSASTDTTETIDMSIYEVIDITDGGGGGAAGGTLRSIKSISKSDTNGLVDTYKIYYTDGTESVFFVTNGKDGVNGSDGADGQDGFSPTVTITDISNGKKLTIADKNGTKTFDVLNGKDGQDGTPGEDGVGIYDISKTSTNGLIDTYTITYTDGGTSTFTVKNGKDGASGSGGGSVDLSDYYTKEEVDTALSGLELGDKNVQSDWNETNTSSDAYIINKPTIPAITNDLTDELKASYDNAATKAHSHTNKNVLDAITSEKVSSWDAKSDFSGSYNDLTDKPEIPSIAGLATETYVDNAVSSVPVYDDTAVQASITALQSGKADKTEIENFQTQAQVESLVASKIAEVVANAPSDFDTLKEIADWISTHENSAASMNTAIAANTNAIANDVVKKSDITISSTDIGEGASLATGALYFVYE